MEDQTNIQDQDYDFNQYIAYRLNNTMDEFLDK